MAHAHVTRVHQPPPRPPRPRRRRGCLGTLLMLAFIAFIVPVFCCGLTLVLYLVFPPSPMDILVLGLDSRPGEGFVARTDSIMLVGIQPARLRVSLLSIPRDLFLDVPGYGLERINTINFLGELEQEGYGPDLMTESIAANFAVQPDRYVRLNFQAFVDIVDAVGGVDIDVERTIVDDSYPTYDGGTISIRFEPGLQHMNGERALQYARTRHGDDDYRRAERQQQVMSALSTKLLNPVTWPAVMGVINRSTDTNLTLWDMARIAPAIVLNAGRFESEVIDRDFITTYGGVAVPDYAALAPWLEERFD